MDIRKGFRKQLVIELDGCQWHQPVEYEYDEMQPIEDSVVAKNDERDEVRAGLELVIELDRCQWHQPVEYEYDEMQPIEDSVVAQNDEPDEVRAGLEFQNTYQFSHFPDPFLNIKIRFRRPCKIYSLTTL